MAYSIPLAYTVHTHSIHIPYGFCVGVHVYASTYMVCVIMPDSTRLELRSLCSGDWQPSFDLPCLKCTRHELRLISA